MGPLQGKIQAAFQCPYPYLIMVQSPSTTRQTPLNLVQQIGRSNVAASVVVEDMEDMRELKRSPAQPRKLQLHPPTPLLREHRRRCPRHAL